MGRRLHEALTSTVVLLVTVFVIVETVLVVVGMDKQWHADDSWVEKGARQVGVGFVVGVVSAPRLPIAGPFSGGFVQLGRS